MRETWLQQKQSESIVLAVKIKTGSTCSFSSHIASSGPPTSNAIILTKTLPHPPVVLVQSCYILTPWLQLLTVLSPTENSPQTSPIPLYTCSAATPQAHNHVSHSVQDSAFNPQSPSMPYVFLTDYYLGVFLFLYFCFLNYFVTLSVLKAPEKQKVLYFDVARNIILLDITV